MPWKNGGGASIEIAVAPSGASLDDFDWRVSMATVGQDGPFSTFPNVDRTLAVLSGQGMIVTIAGREAAILRPGSAPIAFPGDVPTSAQLVGGDILDLNVMTRRPRFSHRLQRITEPASAAFDDHDIAVVFSFNGRTALTWHEHEKNLVLESGDAAILTKAGATSFALQPAAACDCYLVMLRKLPAAL